MNQDGWQTVDLSSYSSTAPSSQECVPMQDVVFVETRPVSATNEAAELDILTRFDFDVRFGPYLGITRLQRWERAQRLGLEPPSEVRDVLPSLELDTLARFDLAVRFGPFLGIAQLERWERAEQLGLQPPVAVRDILLGSASVRNTANCASSARTRLW